MVRDVFRAILAISYLIFLNLRVAEKDMIRPAHRASLVAIAIIGGLGVRLF